MKQYYIMLHIAVLLAGFTGVFGKLITLNEVPLVWYRVLFSAIILFFVLRYFKLEPIKSVKEKTKIISIGLLLVIHWLFFYASIKYSNISIGVVCFCLTSFFTAIFSPIINRHKISLLQLFLSAITVFGISLIFHFDASYQFGIILGVISAALAALYTIFNKEMVQKYDSRVINYYHMSGGVVGLGLFLPLFYYFNPEEAFIPSGKDALYLFFLASVCTVGLYILLVESLKKLPAFTVNISFNLEPIYSIIIAFLFFNESQSVNFSFYLGLLFVVVSVVLQSFISIKKTKR